MHTSVVGFKPPDQDWLMMKVIWDACRSAGVDPPKEVEKFFGGEEPDPAGVEVSREELEKAGCVRRWSEKMREGFEVEVAKVPPGVKVIRFYNSY